MIRKAHGTQNTKHNLVLGECSSTAQRGESLAQPSIQSFLGTRSDFEWPA